MVLPQKHVKESLTEIHDGLTGAHLGRMKTLKKMKTRFWRPGLTKEVHQCCSSYLTCAKCKSSDEQPDYCMMAFRSIVHSSTEHTPFELMFGREMRIPLDVMMGSGPIGNERSYSEFVADLQGSLEAAYRDVRQNLKIAQRRQKDAYDKVVRYMVFQAGDLVLRYDP